MNDDHIVISLKSGEFGDLVYHYAEYDGKTFLPVCGVEMDTPLLVRKADIAINEPRGNWLSIRKGMWRECRNCRGKE